MLFAEKQTTFFPVDRSYGEQVNFLTITVEEGQVGIELTNGDGHDWVDPEDRFTVTYGHDDAVMIYEALGRALRKAGIK